MGVWRLLAVVTLCWAVTGEVGSSAEVRSDVRLPKHLLDFYRQLAEEDAKSRAAGTAVHAILPSKGVLEGSPGQLFNLSSVHDQEVLRHAELHLHRRVLPGRRGVGRGGSLRLRVCQLTPERVAILEDIVLSLNSSSGWQKFDVSAPVRVALTSAKHLLGLRIELKRPGRSHFRPVRGRRLRRWHLQPFIIVYTDDDFSMEDDITHNYLHVPKLTPETPSGGDIGRAGFRPPGGGHGSSSSRLRRSVSDSRLSPYGYYRYEVEGSKAEQSVAVFRHYGEDTAVTEPSDVTAGTDPSLIPYPSNTKRRKWRRRKHKKKRRKHRRRKLPRTRRLPTNWNVTQINTADPASRPPRPPPPPSAPPLPPSAPPLPASACGLRRLTIDFDALGWGESIISPRQFDAFYCAGQCAFPLSRDSHPTNHATIQSLAALLGLQADGARGGPVPAPCCVPDAMDSLTLLYFDETRQNVVLKNYPNMVVKSCSCR